MYGPSDAESEVKSILQSTSIKKSMAFIGLYILKLRDRSFAKILISHGISFMVANAFTVYPCFKDSSPSA